MTQKLGRKTTIGFAICLASVLAVFTIVALDARSAAVNPTAPITLATLMGKLESLQSQMQETARTTEAMRAALEQQRVANGRLLTLLVTRGLPAGSATTAALPAPSPNPPAPPFRPKLTIEICYKIANAAEAKFAAKLEGEGDLDGKLSIDVYGIGGGLELGFKAGTEAGIEMGPEIGVETSACISGFQMDVDDNTAQMLTAAMGTDSTRVTADLSGAYLNSPRMHTTRMTAALGPLQNIQLNLTPAQLMNNMKQPASFFQAFQGITDNLPFPGNTGALIQDPSSIIPTINDFDINTACGGTQVGTLFFDVCGRVQSFTNPLVPITNTLNNVDNVLTNVNTKVDNFINSINGVTSNVTTLINDVGSLQVSFNQLDGQVANLETGVTNLCNGLNSRLTTIRNGVVSFPARNFSLDLGPVGTFNIPVDILRNDQPFAGLSSVGCPTF